MQLLFQRLCFALAAGLISGHVYSDELASDTQVLVSKGVSVTVEDIDRYILATLPTDETARLQVLARPGIYKEMAENLFLIRSMAAEARSAPDFDKEQSQWSSRLLHQRELMKGYRKVYIRSQLKDVNWESTAREHYLANPATYRRGETIRASHILLSVEDRSFDEALALAEELHQQLEAGADFGELAMEYSEDGSAPYGGTLGTFGRGKMVPEFEEVAFALESPGDFSGPVKTPFGYHLILLNTRTPAQSIPFAEVKDSIVKDLQVKMGDSLWQRKLVQMRSRPDVQVDDALLRELRKQHGVRSGIAKQ